MKKRSVLVAFFILLFCVSSILFGFWILINKPSFQRRVISKISKRIGYNIQIDSIKISLFHGIGIRVNGLAIKKEGFDFLCKRIFLIYKLSKLIKRNPYPENIILEEPDLLVKKEKASSKKKFSIQKVFPLLLSFRSISIKNGSISIQTFPLKIRAFNLLLKKTNQNSLNISGLNFYVKIKRSSIPFHAKGNIWIKDKGKVKAVFDSELKNFPLSLIKEEDAIYFLKGRLSVKSEIKIEDQKIYFHAFLHLDNPDFVIVGNDNQKKIYRFPYLNLCLDGNLFKKRFIFHSFKILANGLELDGNGKMILSRESPYISVNIKSDEMNIAMFKKIFPSCFLPKWFENRLLPILKTGKMRNILFSLKGTTDQIKNLDMPQNKKVISGSLVMDRLLVFPKGAGSELKDITGEVILKDGNLLIKHIKAALSSSNIEDADITIKDIYQDTRHYLIYVKGRFYFKDLLGQLNMEFTPDAVKKKLSDLRELSGIMDANVLCEYEESWEMPSFKGSLVRLTNTRILYGRIPDPIFIKDGNFWIDEKGSYHFAGDCVFEGSKLFLKANTDQSFKNISLLLSGIADTEKIMKMYIGNKIIIKGPAKFKVKLKKVKDGWKGSGIISSKRLFIKRKQVSFTPSPFSMSFSLKYCVKKLFIKKILFLFKRSSLYLSGIIKKKDLFLHLRGRNLPIKYLGISLERINSINGTINSDLKIRYFFSDPLKTTLIGKLKVGNFFIKTGDFSIRDSKFYLKFLGKKIIISSANGIFKEYPFYLTGKIRGWDGFDGSLSLRINEFNLLEISSLFKEKRKKKKNSFLTKSNLDIDIGITKAVCKNLVFSPLNTKIGLRKGNVLIKKLSSDLPYGNILFYKEKDAYHLRIRTKEMPLDCIFSCLGIKRYIDGKMSMKSEIYSDTPDIAQFISHMKGKIVILVKDGKIYKAQPVLKILDFFSLANIWKFNPLDVFGDGVPFDLIKIDASVKDGIVSSDKMVLESKALNAAAKGRLDLSKKYIDLGVAIQPLGTIDSILGKLPLVGYIIGGKEKRITLYYFKIKGPLRNVEVKQVPIEHLVKGTFNMLKRILLTPAHIFESINGY